MPQLTISIFRVELNNFILVSEEKFESASNKRLTSSRAARTLSQEYPQFRRRKGRSSSFSGIEVLPVMEKNETGWEAWRRVVDDNVSSGFEPPLTGRVGKLNSKDNSFSDRSTGIWEKAVITQKDFS